MLEYVATPAGVNEHCAIPDVIVAVAQPVIDVPLFLKSTVPIAPVAVDAPSRMVAVRVTA